MATATRPATRSVRHWTGQFIWLGGESTPYHRFVYARGSFDLDDPPQSALLHITASDRYLLYVNGAYLGRGPARSDPRRKSYDRYDVAPHLQPGRNTIAVRAYHYGELRGGGWGTWSGRGYALGERAGLWAQLDMQSADGERVSIGTDASWRLQAARAWNRDVKANILLGSPEVYDASADPVDWMAPEFDDSAWPHASVIPPGDLEWFLLESREIPLLEEREVFPVRVVKVSEVIDMGRPGGTDIFELLNQEIHLPLEHALATEVEAVRADDDRAAEFHGQIAGVDGIRAPCLILDFGRQLFGFPRVRLEAEQGAMLDMTYGQKLVQERIPAALDYGDRYIARNGEQTWDVAEYKQFRYLHITIRSTFAPLRIKSISVNEYRYPAAERGTFTCSDPLVSKLWRACVDTTYLHMEDTIVCDAYRERVPWSVGDGSHGLHMVLAAHGDVPLTDRFLRGFPLSDHGDGMLQMVYPPNNPERYSTAQYMYQWGTRVREHYLHTGRRWVLDELYQSVQRQIDWYAPHRDEMGLLRDLPIRNKIDWTPVDLRGANLSTNALYVSGLEDAAWLADVVGFTQDAARWRSMAAEIRTTLRRVFWNDARGCFEDSYHRGELTGVASEQGNAFALLYGIADDSQIAPIARHFSGEMADLVEASPLYFGYVVDGLLHVGLTKHALDLTRARFAPMLESTDHPTIWESWGPYTGGVPITSDDQFPQHSREHLVRPTGVRGLVHTGGVLVGYVLLTRILGIMPTGAGFATCRIHPRPGDLTWARGVMPAPAGDIKVEWQQAGDMLRLQTEVPDNVHAEVVLDRDPDRQLVLGHNGVNTDLRDPAAVASSDLVLAPDAVRIHIRGGSHTFELGGQST